MKSVIAFSLANRMSSGQARCSQSACQNGATCQEQGSNALCICKPGFTGQRCENGTCVCEIMTEPIGLIYFFFFVL